MCCENGRSDQVTFGRVEMLDTGLILIYAASPGSRRTRKPSWATTTRTGASAKRSRLATASGLLYVSAACWRSEFSESSSTANSSISGSDEQQNHHECCSSAGVSALIVLMAAALNFVVDPLHCSGPRRGFGCLFAGQPDAERRADPQPGFRYPVHGHSLAIHFRQSDIDRVLGVKSLKLAMPGSNSHEQGFVLAAGLARGARRVIWEVTTGFSRRRRTLITMPTCRPIFIVATPAALRVTFQRRHGAGIGVDPGAVVPEVEPVAHG